MTSCTKAILFLLLPVAIMALKEEICEQKGEYIMCPFSKVLSIRTVQYGRTRTGNCNPYHVPNLPTNCRSTQISTNTVIRLCQNRGSCFLEADNTILGEDPCNNIPKYLTVEYDCVDLTTTSRTTKPPPSTSTSTTSTTTSTTSTTTRPTTSTSTTTSTTSPTTTSTTTTRTTPTTTTSTATTPTTTTSTTSRSTTTTPTTTTPTTTTPTTTTPTTTSTRTTPTTTRPTTTASPLVPFSPFNAPPGSQICHDNLLTGHNGANRGQLSASSVLRAGSTDNHGPDRGRLFSDAVRLSNGTYNRGAWSAAYNDQRQYLQVQLDAPSIVRGVSTQGRHVNPADLCCYEHVTKYRVMYSLDCVNFEMVKDSQGKPIVFNGNADQDSVVTNMLPCPIMARCVRINPIDWKNHVSLRFDLLGCPAKTADLGKCPKGWQERPGSNKCYLVTDVHDMRTYDDASAQCQLQQAHLVKIDSIAERDWLRQKMAALRQSQGQHHFWVGLDNRPRTDNKGHTWEDNTPLDTSILPWGQGQPDNSGGYEHCGELWDGDLNDNDCNQHYPYICEKDKFWKPPRNIPKPLVPVPITRTRTTTTTRAPPTVRPNQLPRLPGSVVIKGILYQKGCLNQTDCATHQAGDYQSCRGCHYYMTCAPSGVFHRPCPANLNFDDNLKTCEFRSSTCGPVIG